MAPAASSAQQINSTVGTTPSAYAHEVTGVPGSPDATRSIPGDVLPAPALPFGGEINLNADQSRPWWPPRIAPPSGAPNILLIMTDDVGFSAPSTFVA
jgi:arylsulfatase